MNWRHHGLVLLIAGLIVCCFADAEIRDGDSDLGVEGKAFEDARDHAPERVLEDITVVESICSGLQKKACRKDSRCVFAQRKCQAKTASPTRSPVMPGSPEAICFPLKQKACKKTSECFWQKGSKFCQVKEVSTSPPTDDTEKEKDSPESLCDKLGGKICNKNPSCAWVKRSKSCVYKTPSPTRAPLTFQGTVDYTCATLSVRKKCLKRKDICIWEPGKKVCYGKRFTTYKPSMSPTFPQPTASPSASPTNVPSTSPTTGEPTTSPTRKPTGSPTTAQPSTSPTTGVPSSSPSLSPSQSPTTASPTKSPTLSPTSNPTKAPTRHPTKSPTTPVPSKTPTKSPTGEPTSAPSEAPSKRPTNSPTEIPTVSPSTSPSTHPTYSPTNGPSASPSESPTQSPTTPPPTRSPTATALRTAPNILVMIMDDYRELKEDVPVGLTPSIDSLKADGTEFTNVYVQFPQCGPSRASILTGKYPMNNNEFVSDLHSTGAPYPGPNLGNHSVKAWHDAWWMPKFFQDQGYQVAVAGKVFHTRSVFYPDTWFDTSDIVEDPFIGDEKIPFRVCSGAGNCRCIEEMRIGALVCRDYVTKMLTERWIHRWKDSDRPWFIMTGFVRPHTDFRVASWALDQFQYRHKKRDTLNVPDVSRISWAESPFWGNFDQAMDAYANAVHYIDKYVGDILQTLKDTNQYDDALIILTSDHGMQFGDNIPHFGKWSLFDASLRVPFVVKSPMYKISNPIPVVDDMAESIDLFPTLVDFTGLNADHLGLDGLSVMPLIEGEAQPERKQFSLSMMNLCATSRSGVRIEPCTTKERGGMDMWGIGYSVRTKDYRITEWRRLNSEARSCYGIKTELECRLHPNDCLWLWFVTDKELSSNPNYYCVPNIGHSIDFTADGLIASEVYNNTQEENLAGIVTPSHDIGYYLRQVWYN